MRKTKALPKRSDLNRLIRYDDETGNFYTVDGGYRCENNSGAGYYGLFINGRQYLAHRIAWIMAYDIDPGSDEIDHINGIRTDNRLVNLRLVSSHEQNRNRRLSTRNKSGVKGVCWESSRRKWRATVGSWPNLTLVGRFDSLADATEAVRFARERLHGQFANHGI